MIEYLLPILSAWFTMLIILDPLLSVSMFINLTEHLSKAEVIRQAFIATAVAGILSRSSRATAQALLPLSLKQIRS